MGKVKVGGTLPPIYSHRTASEFSITALNCKCTEFELAGKCRGSNGWRPGSGCGLGRGHIKCFEFANKKAGVYAFSL